MRRLLISITLAAIALSACDGSEQALPSICDGIEEACQQLGDGEPFGIEINARSFTKPDGVILGDRRDGSDDIHLDSQKGLCDRIAAAASLQADYRPGTKYYLRGEALEIVTDAARAQYGLSDSVIEEGCADQ